MVCDPSSDNAQQCVFADRDHETIRKTGCGPAPKARARWCTIVSRRCVRRLYRAKTLSSNRSQKMRRPHRTPSHQNRRVRIDSSTRRPTKRQICGPAPVAALHPPATPLAVRTRSPRLARSQQDLHPVRHHLHRIYCKTVRREARALKTVLHLLILQRTSTILRPNNSKCESEPRSDPCSNLALAAAAEAME